MPFLPSWLWLCQHWKGTAAAGGTVGEDAQPRGLLAPEHGLGQGSPWHTDGATVGSLAPGAVRKWKIPERRRPGRVPVVGSCSRFLHTQPCLGSAEEFWLVGAAGRGSRSDRPGEGISVWVVP